MVKTIYIVGVPKPEVLDDRKSRYLLKDLKPELISDFVSICERTRFLKTVDPVAVIGNFCDIQSLLALKGPCPDVRVMVLTPEDGTSEVEAADFCGTLPEILEKLRQELFGLETASAL